MFDIYYVLFSFDRYGVTMSFNFAQRFSYLGSFSFKYLLPVNGVEGTKLLVCEKKCPRYSFLTKYIIQIIVNRILKTQAGNELVGINWMIFSINTH